MNTLVEQTLALLNTLPAEVIWMLKIAACYGGILVMLRQFGAAGLYVFIAIAVIGANLQVLTATQFSFLGQPVALGTTLFASTYLCTDILNEYYGARAAKRGVLIGFAAFLLFSLYMLIALAYPPVNDPEHWATANREHLSALFTPMPILFVSGMIAYLLSQYHDIWAYRLVMRLTHRRSLWLRNNASTLLSALIDNTLFSVLAWRLLAAEPLPWNDIVFTYILGTYWMRVVLAILDTPFLYLARHLLPRWETRDHE